MIKRALGLWAGSGGADVGADVDSDEELLPEERRKLERRFLPGSIKGKKAAGKKKPKASAAAESDEDDSDADGPARGGWASSDPSDDDEEESEEEHPEMPVGPDKQDKERGKFFCQLCPNKVLLNEKLLEAHLQSAAHKKNERRFERAQALGVEGYEAECKERAKAREAQARGEKSKRKLKNEGYWEKKRDKSKRKDEKDKASDLSEADIQKLKEKFQAKKSTTTGGASGWC
jgi:hypothetical protein